MRCENACSVTPITERLADSGILMPAEGECHENNLRGLTPCFRIHDRHGGDHDHFAGCVMKAILMVLGRGFALFAGGPAVIYQYPALSRSAVVVKIEKRGRGSSEW
jgi:hypothetical protein